MACNNPALSNTIIDKKIIDQLHSNNRIIFNNTTYSVIGSGSKNEYYIFIQGSDEVSENLISVLSVILDTLKEFYDDKYDKTNFVKNIIYNGSASGSPWGALCVNGYSEGDLIFADSTKTYLMACVKSATNVNLPNSVIQIGDYAFYECTNLSSITIPDSVAIIGQYAFYGCTNLSNVTLPNSVTTIGQYAFYGCSNVTNITLSNSVASIGQCAFYNCSGITSIDIPNSMTSINSSVFRNCTNLTSVTLPNSITSIGSNAFKSCSSLTDIYCEAINAPTITNTSFSLCNSLLYIHIPCNGLASYSTNWSTYIDLLTIPTTPSFSRILDVLDSNQGSISLLSQPCQDSTLMAAIANYGFHFSHWNDGDTTNPRTFILTQDTAFTAHFAPDQFSVWATSANDTMGTVSGSDTVDYLQTVTLTATANYGYHFTQWNDGNSDNPRTFILTQDTAFTAHFAPDQFSVWATSANDTMGTVSGSDTVDYLQTVTLTATANYGYHFTQWNDGNSDNPRQVIVTSDSVFTALFEEDTQYDIIVMSADNTMGQTEGSGSFYLGELITIAATPNDGYHFQEWNDGNTDNPRQIIVSENATYIATFAQNIGIKDVNPTVCVKVFPNPVQSTANLMVDGFVNEATVMLIEMQGHILQQFTLPQNNTLTKIDMSNLPSGLYYLIIKSNDIIKIEKIIKR